MSKSRLIGIFLSLLLLSMAFASFANKGWKIVRGAPQLHTIGYVFLVGGLGLLVFSILSKEFPDKNRPEFVICPSCLSPYRIHEIENEKCPKCGTKVEDIKGFYDRHPELKNREKT